ncbi:hypothetical protein NQ318_004059 [Aromia moschata]|uniref:Uncharacterized protein n=1 Tax=Aromia moschata TaxID=1265417 RepID=A0AAV8Z7Z4_9CUCU|nr:hypothetical protein NQ318_004059 [Aromia moschata]
MLENRAKLENILLTKLAQCYILDDYSENIPFVEYHVASTKIEEINVHTLFNFKIELYANESFEISIRIKNIEVMDWKTNFYIYRDNSEDHVNIRKDNLEVVEGFIMSKENASSVVGYIKDAFFYGTVDFENTVYYVEELKKYPKIYRRHRDSKLNAIIYKENSMSFASNSSHNETIVNSSGQHAINFIKADNEKELFKSIIGNGKVCTLFILVDNPYLRRVHNNDIRSATLHILNSVEKANSLFRSTDFDEDGVPDNIGFIIKYFIVLQSENSDMNLLPYFRKEPIEGTHYINAFSQYRLLNEVCLGVAFTGFTFKNNVLGISYTAEPANKQFFRYTAGGICERPFKFESGKNLNTLAISAVLKSVCCLVNI